MNRLLFAAAFILITASPAASQPISIESGLRLVECPDYSVTAPVENEMGTTCGMGNDCDLRASEEVIYEVDILNDGEWVFSLCGSDYDTYLFVGTTCCGQENGANDDFCGLQSQLTAVITAGTYYVAIEGFSGCGYYVLNIYQEETVVECPPNGIPELEACGDDTNGGCDMEPGTEYFEPLEWGTIICGTAWADGGLRDTDWYALTATETATLVISGEAEFPFELAIILPGDPDPCLGFSILAVDQAAEGEILTIQTQVDPGEVWVRASDAGLEGNPCGDDNDDYYIYLPCDDFINIEIETDQFPGETSWELIERASGTVIASAGPLSDPCTVHTWQVCADRALCYDWYVYDSFGDGIHSYGCGYYSVFGFDGELLCMGGEFAYVDVCPDIGTCLPRVGACCIELVCGFNSEEQVCLDAGGTWYEGETCPEFECPIDPCLDAVWQNGLPSAYGYASQCDPVYPFQSVCVDDFILPGEPGQYLIDVTGVIAWFSHWDADPLATPADYEGVTVTIYNDDDGHPGGAPTQDPDCGVYGDYEFHRYYEPGQFLYLEELTDVWRLQIEISDLILNSGVTYWLAIEPVMSFAEGFGQSGSTPTDQQTGSPPLFWDSVYGWSTPSELDFDVSFCILGPLPPCDYIPGDCDHNGVPLELGDVVAMVGMYRGAVVPPYECYCPPNGDNFNPTADPNGNCVANELGDVVKEIAAYRGSDTASGCEDCPGSGRLLPGGNDQPIPAPSLKSKTKGKSK